MFGVFYDGLARVTEKVIGPIARSAGKSLYLTGTRIQGESCTQDRLVPSLRNLTYNGASPNLENAQFVAPNATILGRVNLGVHSSVWYGATLIGTKGIDIGKFSVIQDRTHLSNKVKIGDHVFVGPNCVIQGSQLGDRSFVSMGATVRQAKVETGALVAAGAVIMDNVTVKQGQIWAGNPGKFLRNITPIQREVLSEHLDEMRDLAVIHSQQTEKNPRQVISGQLEPFQSTIFEDEMQRFLVETQSGEDLPITELDEEFVQRRTIMRQIPQYYQVNKDFEPYEHNIAFMGEKFNLGVHNQAYKKVATKLTKKQRFNSDTSAWTKPY